MGSQRTAAILHHYYYSGGGAPALNYSQDLLYSMFLNQDVRPQVDTPPAFEVVSDSSVRILGEDLIRSFAPVARSTKGADGNYYFTLPGREDAGRDVMVYKYNPSTNIIEQFYRIRHGLVSEDTHRGTATIAINADGYIIIVYESLHKEETHGSAINVWKTDIPYDLNSLRRINVLFGRWSYPYVAVSGDDVFVMARGSPNLVTFIRGEQWYWNSSDGGQTFSAPVKLYDSDNENQVSYMFLAADFTGGITIAFNERSNTTVNWTFAALFRGSFGSDVWTDVSGSFSKNVGTSGFITRTEVVNNCLIVQAATTNNDVNIGENAVVKSDGTVIAIIAMQTQTGNEFAGNPEDELDELRFYVYDEGWDFENVDIPEDMVLYWVYQRAWAFRRTGDSVNDILFIDRNNNNDVYRYRSNDNFVTQTNTLVLAGNGKYRASGFLGDLTDSVMLIADTDGDVFELKNEGPEDYSDIIILQI